MKKNIFICNNQSGQAFILAIIALSVVLVNTLLILSGALNFSQNSKYTLEGVQATNLAEAGIDKAVASLNATGGSYNGEGETQLDPGSYTVTITTKDASTKIVEATGYIPNKTNPKTKRTVKIQVSKGVGASFNYAVQVGEGGLEMSNNSKVVGSVYSNGNIEMENNSQITGDAFVAGGIQPSPDQQTDCTAPNCSDLVFGKTSGSQLDVAQGFQPSQNGVLNKVSLKLKKIGNPSDLTVRLLGSSGNCPNCIPDKNQVLASGVLYSSLVTGQYGFADVVFSTVPTVSAGATYWIMLDTAPNPTNYWSWSLDSLSSYTKGQALWSSNWQAPHPTWNSIPGDLGFKTYMGGVATSLEGANGVTVLGSAHANTLINLVVQKDAYYQVAQGLTAAVYHPGSADPVAQVMPIADANIQEWKDEAVDTKNGGGTYPGDISSCKSTLLKGKYVGNIALPGNCTVTINSPVWVTGNLNFGGNDVIKLNPSYGTSSGVIIVDGIINMNNNNKLQGSGTQGSYMFLISTYNTRDDPSKQPAINVQNGGNTGVIYSNLGGIQISNNNSLTAVTGWKLSLSNNVVVTYDQGLSGTFFSSGPGGTFTAIKGTYQNK